MLTGWFTRKRNPITFDGSVDGAVLPRKSSVANQGITFDRCLTFSEHIPKDTNNAFRN